MKKWYGLKSLGEKSWEIKPKMAAMMLMLINFDNNAIAVTVKIY